MIRLRHFMLLVLLPVIVSCGQMICCGKDSPAVGNVTVAPITPILKYPTVLEPTPGEFARIVILPFADYSPTNSYDLSSPGYWRRNILILEALQDEFYRFGFKSAVVEDVVTYLFYNNIIVTAKQSEAPEVHFSMETQNLLLTYPTVKDTMAKNMVKKAVYSNMARNLPPTPPEPQNTITQNLIALDGSQLYAMGRFFNADYIVRGRIIEYGMEDADSLNPLKTGLLPFAFKFGSRTLFGFSKSEAYEAFDQMAIGAALGQIGANNIPIFTQGALSPEAAAALSGFLWAGMGGAVALMANEGGKVPSAYVQIRVIVQNARTGEIVWFNRAEAETTGMMSAYSKPKERNLYAQAIQQAARSLVENFVNTTVLGKHSYTDAPPNVPGSAAADTPKSPVPPSQ